MRKYLHYLLPLAILFTSCIKELEFPENVAELDRNIWLPIVDSKVGIADIKRSDDSLLMFEEDPVEKFYTIKIGTSKFDFPSAESFIKLAPQGINITTLPGITITNAEPTTVVGMEIDIDLAQSDTSALAGAQIRKIDLKGGTLQWAMRSTLFSNNVNVTLTFTGIINNSTGRPLTLFYTLSGNAEQQNQQNLNNFTLSLAGTNKLNVLVGINVIGNTSPANVAQLLTTRVTLSNLSWKRIDGKLGNVNVPILDGSFLVRKSVPVRPFVAVVSAFNSADDVVLSLSGARMRVKFENSFGFASQASYLQLSSNTRNGLVKNVTAAPFVLNKPSDPAVSMANFPAITTNELDQPTVAQLMQIGPKEVNYGLRLIVNSAQTTPNDFILDNSRITAETNLDLPLNGYMDGLRIESEVNYSGSSSSSSEPGSDNPVTAELGRSIFKLSYENAIPFRINLQVFFVDARGVIFDQLFTSLPNTTVSSFNISASGVNANGFSQTPARGFITTEFNEARMKKIREEAETIKFVCTFNTAGAPNRLVKITAADKLRLQFSVFAGAKVKFNLNDNND